MKIRQGFVSNSSSASYIVDIQNIEEKEFFDVVQGMYCGGYVFDSEYIVEQLQQIIEEAKSEIREKNTPMTVYYIDKVKRFRALKKEALRISSNKNMIKFGLKINGITYNYKDSVITLSSWTSMHNSFNDGPSDVLKEIILTFLFNGRYKMNCKMEDHSL